MVTQGGVSWEVPETVYAGHSLTEGWTDPFRHPWAQLSFYLAPMAAKRFKD